MIHDSSLIYSDEVRLNGSKFEQKSNKVLSETVTIHVLQIKPSNRHHLDKTTGRFELIDGKRFDSFKIVYFTISSLLRST